MSKKSFTQTMSWLLEDDGSGKLIEFLDLPVYVCESVKSDFSDGDGEDDDY